MPSRPTVLFVCVHNAGRSQMAAGWLRHLAGERIEVLSAGSAPGDRVNPVAIEAMAEVGIDISQHSPRVLAVDDVRASDAVITMGCGDACPVFPGKRYEDWALIDPAGQGIETVRAVRDQIKVRVEALIEALLPAAVPSAEQADVPASLPVAVIGAGPIGLAAAAQLLVRGQAVEVFESGPGAGHAMSQWAHTRFFSPWEYVLDDAAVRLLESHGWVRPQAGKNPRASEFLDAYLLPLANTPELAAVVHYGTRVLAVSKRGMDRTRTAGRDDAPFQLQLRGPGGLETRNFRAVIDASGTWSAPNPVLSSGLPVQDPEAAARILTALPDVLGAQRAEFAGRHTVVVGAGHSAANTLLKLAQLARAGDGTRVSWVVRAKNPTRVYGSANDELAARGQLGTDVRALVASGAITLVDSFEIDEAALVGGLVRLAGRRAGQPFSLDADRVVAATGFRPELGMLREVRLATDDVVEAPSALAGLIDPNEHSCGTVYPHGVAELSHPDANFFIAGMKSYGRAPTFLMLTGYEQVRSIADELAGNHEAARVVQLVLPETGVCSTSAENGGGGGGCGGPEVVPGSAGTCSAPAAPAAPESPAGAAGGGGSAMPLLPVAHVPQAQGGCCA